MLNIGPVIILIIIGIFCFAISTSINSQNDNLNCKSTSTENYKNYLKIYPNSSITEFQKWCSNLKNEGYNLATIFSIISIMSWIVSLISLFSSLTIKDEKENIEKPWRTMPKEWKEGK